MLKVWNEKRQQQQLISLLTSFLFDATETSRDGFRDQLFVKTNQDWLEAIQFWETF